MKTQQGIRTNFMQDARTNHRFCLQFLSCVHALPTQLEQRYHQPDTPPQSPSPPHTCAPASTNTRSCGPTTAVLRS
jgi:hypothetical protein